MRACAPTSKPSRGPTKSETSSPASAPISAISRSSDSRRSIAPLPCETRLTTIPSRLGRPRRPPRGRAAPSTLGISIAELRAVREPLRTAAAPAPGERRRPSAASAFTRASPVVDVEHRGRGPSSSGQAPVSVSRRRPSRPRRGTCPRTCRRPRCSGSRRRAWPGRDRCPRTSGCRLGRDDLELALAVADRAALVVLAPGARVPRVGVGRGRARASDVAVGRAGLRTAASIAALDRQRRPSRARAHAAGEPAGAGEAGGGGVQAVRARRRRPPSRAAAPARRSRADGGSARRARRRRRSGRRRTRPSRSRLLGDPRLDVEVALAGRPRAQRRPRARRAASAPSGDQPLALGRQEREPQLGEVVVDVDAERRRRRSRGRRRAASVARGAKAAGLVPRRLVQIDAERRQAAPRRRGAGARRSSSARRPSSRVTTSQSGLAGLPGSIRFVSPPVSQATGPVPGQDDRARGHAARGARARARASTRPRRCGRRSCASAVVRPYRTSFAYRERSHVGPPLSIAGQTRRRRSVRHSEPCSFGQSQNTDRDRRPLPRPERRARVRAARGARRGRARGHDALEPGRAARRLEEHARTRSSRRCSRGGFVADAGAGMSRRYRLGMALARLGDVVVSQIALRDVAMPVMRDLTAATGLTSRRRGARRRRTRS